MITPTMSIQTAAQRYGWTLKAQGVGTDVYVKRIAFADQPEVTYPLTITVSYGYRGAFDVASISRPGYPSQTTDDISRVHAWLSL